MINHKKIFISLIVILFLTPAIPALSLSKRSLNINQNFTPQKAKTFQMSETLFRRGDANTDGQVNIADAIIISNYIYRGKNITCLDAADTNDDGKIDIADQIFLLNYLFKGGATPPAPGPTNPGVDPSSDNLDCQCYQCPISRGTLKVIPTPGATAEIIPEGLNQQIVGKFDFVVKNEDLKINSISFRLNLKAKDKARILDLANITLFDWQGKLVGGPKNPAATGSDGSNYYGQVKFTDPLIVPKGVTTYTLKADLNTNYTRGDTLQMQINPIEDIAATGISSGENLTAADFSPTPPQFSAIYTINIADLKVSVSLIPVAQSVPAGAKNFTFANFIFDATGSSQDIKLTQIKAEMDTTTVAPADFFNFRIYDGEIALALTEDPDPLSNTMGAAATTTFIFIESVIIPKGTAKILTIKADISPVAVTGVIRVGLHAPSATYVKDQKLILAYGKQAGDEAEVYVNSSDGQTMTLVPSGTLTIAKAPSSPKASLLPGNTLGLTTGVLRFLALYEDAVVEKIYLSAASTRNPTDSQPQSAFNQIDAVYLYEGAELLGSGIPTTTNAQGSHPVLIELMAKPLIIPQGTIKDITIKADTAGVRRDISSRGWPGQGFIFSLETPAAVVAKGAMTKSPIENITLMGASLEPMIVYKSVPTITANDQMGGEGVSGGAGKLTADIVAGDVYKFKATADSKGDVGLYSVSFLVTTSSATVTKLYLRNGTVEVAATTTGAVLVDDEQGDQVIYHLIFTKDGLPANPRNTANNLPYTITAGQTKTLTLKADIICGTKGKDCSGGGGSGNVSFQLLGDTAFPAIYPDSARTLYDNPYKNSLIWTDFAVSGVLGTASTTASTAEQWTNGYWVASASGKLAATSTPVVFSQ